MPKDFRKFVHHVSYTSVLIFSQIRNPINADTTIELIRTVHCQHLHN